MHTILRPNDWIGDQSCCSERETRVSPASACIIVSHSLIMRYTDLSGECVTFQVSHRETENAFPFDDKFGKRISRGRKDSCPPPQSLSRPSILTYFANQFTSLVFVFCIVFVAIVFVAVLVCRWEEMIFCEESRAEQRERQPPPSLHSLPPLSSSVFRCSVCATGSRLIQNKIRDDIMMIMRVMSGPEVHEAGQGIGGGKER